MKNKFYASLLIWVGLMVAALPGVAKPAQPSAKKQPSSAAKPSKTNAVSSKKSEPPTSKKTPAKTVAKQTPSQSKTRQVADTKDSKNNKSKAQQLADSKHGNSKAQQLADAKDSKHGKSKAQQLADAKDSKRGKSKAQQLADAKDDKRGKSKAQQLADAKENKRGKHGKTKSRQVEDEPLYGEASDGDASTAVVEGEATTEPEQLTAPDIYSQNNAQKNSPLITTPEKSSSLFFPPAPSAVINAKPSDNGQAPDNPFIGTPPKASNPMANNERMHSLITQGAKPYQSIDNSHETSSESSENNNLLIQPSNNKRIRTSLGARNSNIINNASNSETTQQVASAHGVVDGSLPSAGEKAGLSNDMVIELTDIFAWDIDFANNLQEGDQFTVLYEEGAGNAHNRIIAAQFVNRGKTYTAIRYKDKEGIISYYTPEGRSLRKAFLSSPLDYAKVSSHFDPHRRHPILNRIRAHKGVDYAARTGTPVKAAGDGVILSHENRGAYGRMIVISHGEHYQTAYAHLSNFRKDLQDGEPVKQGDVIGYVGSSGLATGPHLHYEFRVDGEHRDPEKLDSQQAMRLPNGIWEDFHAQTIPVLTRLNQAKTGTLVAKNL
ncbi:MAG: peptidoglycan DD-metalloendopeptidase family protein [Methylococcales bacterium]|nr:peptidoglycan DD-metalloendopeptidase family protein [Methylococcales bacterium]